MKEKPSGITAQTLLDLLLLKHQEKWVCVPECKTGSSWTTEYWSMDLWAMCKSWSNPCVRAYEIKVSRSDFLGDRKWPNYLRYCNELYFAAPPGVIDPAELPDEVGLMVCTKNATRFYTKKKAPYRKVDIPNSVFRYLLMWRTQIKRERSIKDSLSYWKDWLDKKKESQAIGHRVSKRLGRLVREKVDEVQGKQSDLESKIALLEDVKKYLAEIGVPDVSTRIGGRYGGRNAMQGLIKQAETGIPDGITYQINSVVQSLSKLAVLISEHEGK